MGYNDYRAAVHGTGPLATLPAPAATVSVDDVLAKIDARIASYYTAAETAGRPQDARKYEEGAHALEALRLDVQVLALPVEPEPAADPLYADVPAPTVALADTRIVKASAGSYNLVQGGVVTWSILNTRTDDWYDHNPEYPWAAIRLFPSGGQVEARFTTLAAAKKYLLG